MVNRALLWDLDGVIADTAPFHYRAWQMVADELGIIFRKADFNRCFGKRNHEILTDVINIDVSVADQQALADKKEMIFRELIGGRVQIFPGVLALLSSANEAGWNMAVVSSTPPENIELILGTLEIGNYFNIVISDKDVTQGKPDPECFLLAAKRLDLLPNRCVVIEDAVAGVEAAKKGGMKCIAVTNTNPRKKLEQADLVVDSLECITIELLDRVLQ